MDAGTVSMILFGLMLLLLASGIWVALSLMAVGFVALAVFSPAPAGSLLASTVWDASWNWALTALPLFVWMGEILFRTRLSADMFTGLAPWLARRRSEDRRVGKGWVSQCRSRGAPYPKKKKQ